MRVMDAVWCTASATSEIVSPWSSMKETRPNLDPLHQRHALSEVQGIATKPSAIPPPTPLSCNPRFPPQPCNLNGSLSKNASNPTNAFLPPTCSTAHSTSASSPGPKYPPNSSAYRNASSKSRPANGNMAFHVSYPICSYTTVSPVLLLSAAAISPHVYRFSAAHSRFPAYASGRSRIAPTNLPASATAAMRGMCEAAGAGRASVHVPEGLRVGAIQNCALDGGKSVSQSVRHTPRWRFPITIPVSRDTHVGKGDLFMPPALMTPLTGNSP